MKKSVVLMKKNFFIYNGEEYEFNRISEIGNLLKANLKIIILEEELYAKQFTSNLKGNQIYKFVENKINNDFLQNGDILYDFQKSNNTIAIYYIKGAKRIEKLSETAKNIEVKPIQFIVREVLEKVLNNENFNCSVLLKFQEFYYYMIFRSGLFYSGFANEERELIFNKILENNEIKEIYFDFSIPENQFVSTKFKLIKINLGELINEKIYENQGFYSRKIL